MMDVHKGHKICEREVLERRRRMEMTSEKRSEKPVEDVLSLLSIERRADSRRDKNDVIAVLRRSSQTCFGVSTINLTNIGVRMHFLFEIIITSLSIRVVTTNEERERRRRREEEDEEQQSPSLLLTYVYTFI